MGSWEVERASSKTGSNRDLNNVNFMAIEINISVLMGAQHWIRAVHYPTPLGIVSLHRLCYLMFNLKALCRSYTH